jgi:H/ACA ribonucleoprotein complex subunit 4
MTDYLLPSEIPHELLIKSQEATNQDYGKSPSERTVVELLENGVIFLDKPSGPTSHEVAAWLKKVIGIDKVGHGGTLDPKVTGILPCAIGSQAPKAIKALQAAGKEYVCIIKFHKEQSQRAMEKAFEVFSGAIIQRPPLRSNVARKLRVRHIYYTQLLEVQESLALFRIGCEAGTYIRKYCYDIGEALLCGAHMAELRRTKVGSINEDLPIVTLQTVADAMYYHREGDDELLQKVLYPIEKAVQYIPKIVLRDAAVDAICHGADLAAPGALEIDATIKTGDEISFMTQKGELVAFGESTHNANEILRMPNGIVAKTTRVFMERGTYPQMWGKNQ